MNNIYNYAEIHAMSYFTKNGYLVSKPIINSTYYDFIVDDGSVLKKVEVKSSTFKAPSGNYTVSLRTNGGNRSQDTEKKRIDENKCDYVFIYTDDGSEYLFESSILHGKNSITVNKDMKEYIKI